MATIGGGYLSVEKVGDVTVVVANAVCHHIDESNVEEIGRDLMGVIQACDPPLMVLALDAVEFFGSSFIEVLFRAWNRLNSQSNAKLVLCELQPYCREVVEVTHLNRLWPIETTRAAALKLASA